MFFTLSTRRSFAARLASLLPGLGFAELGPGDLGLALGYITVPRDPYPPEMRQARERVFAACRKHRSANSHSRTGAFCPATRGP